MTKTGVMNLLNKRIEQIERNLNLPDNPLYPHYTDNIEYWTSYKHGLIVAKELVGMWIKRIIGNYDNR